MKGRDEFLGIQDTLKALADPIRREILNLLKNILTIVLTLRVVFDMS